VRFAWIKEHAGEFRVIIMCDALNVSDSGYYAWIGREPSPRQQRRQELVAQIRAVHQESHEIYGSPRIYIELKEQGVDVCLNTVAKYMRQEQIRSKVKRPFRLLTTDSDHPFPVAANLLQREFEAAAPDRKWCCDITHVSTDQGPLYLAVVIDCCSRRIVGWEMADHLRAELCLEALRMAIERRRPAAGLLHHSDRGVQYASCAYREFLERAGMVASMSRTGNCYDNALMESFFATLKGELVHHQHYATRQAARSAIFRYIEVFYNRRRRHSAIGYKSPEQFEASLN
jgi:transposase InsO family protein